MCLAVPMKVTEIRTDGTAVCNLDGIEHETNLSLVDVQLGDYVIVHAGFAIEKLDLQEAEARIALFEELAASQKTDSLG